MTKEEKIKDLEFLNEMKSNVDEMVDGYDLVNLQHVQQMINDWIYDLETSQSESENNNGWIKIKNEADLPKENSIFWTLRHGSTVPLYKEVFNDLDVNYWLKTYTHYQPIVKPEPPIY